jgi:hypothetical protein
MVKRFVEWMVGSNIEQALLEGCRDAVRALVPGAEVILYGSRARGGAGPELEEATLLLASGYANTFVSRLDYACFYAISALLPAKGLSSASTVG